MKRLLFLVVAVLLVMVFVAAPAGAIAAPTVTALNFHWGPAAGGKTVVIRGTDFIGATAVSFGDVPAAGFRVVSATEITATAPLHAMGWVQVRVTTPGGSSANTSADDYAFTVRTEAPATSVGGFTYYPSVGAAGSTVAWQKCAAIGASGGSYERTSQGGAYVALRFTGTYLVWVTTLDAATGSAAVSVDGGPAVTVNVSRMTTSYQRGVWSTGRLPFGTHTVRIGWTGPPGTSIGIDAVDVVGGIVGAPSAAAIISHGPRTAKNIALTFDMGGATAPAVPIMNWLIANKVHATIFPTGKTGTQTTAGLQVLALIKSHPDLFRLANHSWDHPDFTDLTAAQMRDQLTRTEAAVAPLAGQTTLPLFRPPYGAYNTSVAAAVGSVGCKYLIMWDVSTGDSEPQSLGGPTVSYIVNRVKNYAQGGSIVLMHLGGENTLAALPGILAAVRAKGLTPVTLGEMFGI